MPSKHSSTLNVWTGSISNRRGAWLVFIVTLFYRNSCIKYIVDPDQMLHSAASDLGLHCSQCPFNEMLGINGLKEMIFSSENKFFPLRVVAISERIQVLGY